MRVLLGFERKPLTPSRLSHSSGGCLFNRWIRVHDRQLVAHCPRLDPQSPGFQRWALNPASPPHPPTPPQDAAELLFFQTLPPPLACSSAAEKPGNRVKSAHQLRLSSNRTLKPHETRESKQRWRAAPNTTIIRNHCRRCCRWRRDRNDDPRLENLKKKNYFEVELVVFHQLRRPSALHVSLSHTHTHIHTQ